MYKKLKLHVLSSLSGTEAVIENFNVHAEFCKNS
jgi:hypothetical protein